MIYIFVEKYVCDFYKASQRFNIHILWISIYSDNFSELYALKKI